MKPILTRIALLAAVALSPALAQAQDTLPPLPPPPGTTHTVPEPGSLALASMAIAASLALRRRRAARSAA